MMPDLEKSDCVVELVLMSIPHHIPRAVSLSLLEAVIPFGIPDKEQSLALPIDQQHDACIIADLAVEISEGERRRQHAGPQLAKISGIKIRWRLKRNTFRDRCCHWRQTGLDKS